MTNTKEKPTFVQRFEEVEKTVYGMLDILNKLSNKLNDVSLECSSLSEQLESVYDIAEKSGLKITVDEVEKNIVNKRIEIVESSVQKQIDAGVLVETGEIEEDSVILLELSNANISRALQKISVLSDTELKSRLIGQREGFFDAQSGLHVHGVYKIVQNNVETKKEGN